MAVPFAQALQTLESMFGGVDRLVIEEVLEANGGNMDQTVDQLLQIAGDIPDDGSNPTSTAAPTADSTPTTPAVAEEEVKQYRQPLAADFLVLPESYIAEHTTSSTSSAQMREDEMLAQLLENEDFLEELRQHPEFVDYMPGQQQQQQATGYGYAPQYQEQQQQQYQQQQQHAPNAIRPMNGSNQVGSYRAPGAPPGQGNPNFEQQRAQSNPDDNMGAKIMLGWSKMSSGAKSKFNALATRFKGTGPSSGNDYSNVPTHEPLLGSDDEQDGDNRRLGMTGRKSNSSRFLSLHRPRDGMLEPMEQLLPSNEEYPPSPSGARDGQVIDTRSSREGVDGFQEGLGNDYASLSDGNNEQLKHV